MKMLLNSQLLQQREMIYSQIIRRIKSCACLIALLFLAYNGNTQNVINIDSLSQKLENDTIRAFLTTSDSIPYTGLAFVYDDTIKVKQISYKDGLLTGEWIEWHKNGVIKSRGYYHCSKEQGDYKSWDKKGRLATEGQFSNGMKEGIWIFYENGAKTTVGEYRNDLKNGVWGEFNEEGQRVLNKIYEKGNLKEILYFD